ncbi:MAG: CDP-alcohol phosphatidyltransferase family protein [Arenicellales bacterium]
MQRRAAILTGRTQLFKQTKRNRFRIRQPNKNVDDAVFSQIPNLLTLSRMFMVPVVIVLLDSRQYEFALIVFFIAGVTDGLDGWIAKKFELQSTFGAMLDPIADKLLLVSTYAMLAVLGDIPFWLLVLVVFRDVMIVGGYWVLIAMDKKVEIQPIWMSKFNTLFQIILVVLVLMHHAHWLALESVLPFVIAIVVFTTIFSGLSYMRAGFALIEPER